MLARAPSSVPPLPRQGAQSHLLSEAQSNQVNPSSTSAMQPGWQMEQTAGMTQFLPAVPSYWQQQQQQQQQWQQQQQQQHVQSYGRTDGLAQHQCMQPMPASMHPLYGNSQQSWGPGASSAPSSEQWQSNPCPAQQQYSRCQTSAGSRLWEPNQHVPLVIPHQAAMHQVPLQAGPAAYPAAVSAVTTAVDAAGSPWVRRAWYPTMPAGLQLPCSHIYPYLDS